MATEVGGLSTTYRASPRPSYLLDFIWCVVDGGRLGRGESSIVSHTHHLFGLGTISFD